MLASPVPIVYDTAAPDGWPEAAVGLAAGMEAIGYGSVMGQPLRIGDRLIGVIGFANRAERRAFTALEQRVALRISERVALAIENARIASERSEIAETLQNGLRPADIPSVPGWSLAALYSPAGSENRAGGDFYDLFRIEGGWMAVVGDVTGHGARAASLTALARYTLRTASSLTGDPQRALAELNDALLAQPGAALCSVAAFTLDQPAAGEVRVAVAGHPPPIVVHGRETREIHPPGPLLGAFDDAQLGARDGDARARRQARRLHRRRRRGPRKRGPLRRGSPVPPARRGRPIPPRRSGGSGASSTPSRPAISTTTRPRSR